jgi:hypothetical protein
MEASGIPGDHRAAVERILNADLAVLKSGGRPPGD